MLRRDEISLSEFIEARYFLEMRVARLAAERASAEDLQALDQTIAAMIEHQHQVFSFVQADLAFHEALARAARNRVFLSFLNCIRDVLSEGMLLGSTIQGAIASSIVQHQVILAAVRAHDSEGAQHAMSEHLQSSFRQQMKLGYMSQAPVPFSDQESVRSPNLADIEAFPEPSPIIPDQD
jgi:GntR family transcriptional repressor for pyruvate dehydrogenase complex